MPLELCPDGRLALTPTGKIKICGCLAGCCFYPWPGLFTVGGSTYYPHTDTPDALPVTSPYFSETIFNKVSAPDESGFRWEAIIPMEIAGDPMDVTWSLVPLVGGEDPQWELTAGFGADYTFNSPCLIGPYAGISGGATVVDEFPDVLNITFTIDHPDYGTPITVECERVSECEWWSVWADGEVSAKYNSATYKYEVNVTSSLEPYTAGPAVKQDPQDTPEGSYDDGPNLIDVSVSA